MKVRSVTLNGVGRDTAYKSSQAFVQHEGIYTACRAVWEPVFNRVSTEKVPSSFCGFSFRRARTA